MEFEDFDPSDIDPFKVENFTNIYPLEIRKEGQCLNVRKNNKILFRFNREDVASLLEAREVVAGIAKGELGRSELDSVRDIIDALIRASF
ncbi:MAG: hypothetical protein K9M08_17780 [Pirellula sp.]|nr:hypothetical protein [Pirellula sp.]